MVLKSMVTERPTIAQFYSSEADAYRNLWAPELLHLSRALLREIPMSAATSVLEVGAGVGALLPQIQQAAPDATVVGVDLAEGMISLAPREYPLAVMDAARLGLGDASFNAAILAFILFHIPEMDAALLEVKRVLRRHGRIATITWGEDPGYRALDIWNEELEAHGASSPASLARHELVDTPEKVASLLRAAGFSLERTWTGVYDNPMTPDEFLAHRTGHGMSRYRYEMLDATGRLRCLDRVRGRIRDLAPDDLRDRAEVIYASALND